MFGHLLSTFRIQNFRILAQKLNVTSTNNPTSAIQDAPFLIGIIGHWTDERNLL